MIGLYFLFLVALWIGFVLLVSMFIAKRLPTSKWRPLFGVCLFTTLLPLLFIDELIGKWQFERLCQENSTIYIAPDAKGKTVYLAEPHREYIKGTWVRIWKQNWRYVDATTGETIVSYNTLGAVGGWFVRTFYNEREGPFLFKKSYSPPTLVDTKNIMERNGINRIQRENLNNHRETLQQRMNK